jgi:uncharacterized protein
MRRADKQIKDIAEIESVIQRSQVCRLGMCRDGQPYVVPLCFGYEDGVVYAHCATEGMKLDILSANDAVCVEFEADLELVWAEQACDWGMKYRSVIGFGRAFVVTDIESKRVACDIIMRHYSDAHYDYSDAALDRIAVIRIEIDEMTGKESGY